MTIRTLRRVVQLLFLAFFIWLLYESRRVPPGRLHCSELFLRTDPLSAGTAALAGHWSVVFLMIPALVLLVLTLFLGRFFCGWVCPLGTCLDATDKLFARRHAHYQPRRSWKYYLLGAILVAALMGAQLGWWLDPLPLLERTLVVVFHPLALAARDFLAVHARGPLQALGLRLDPVGHPGYALGLPVAVVFLTLVGLGAWAPRFWCRSFCPLGALLGFLGRFAPLRRHVNDECSSCGLCERTCKMGAIPAETPERTLTAECILCWNCVACPTRANYIGFRRVGNQVDRTLDTRKRAFLQALGVGAFTGLVLATGLGRRPRGTRLLRPPGANRRTASGSLTRMSEEEFRGRCIRCGACMRACPTGGLQPVMAEAGFDGVFTPVLVPTVGWCEKECQACGEVCPTGALQPFAIEEKPEIKLGLATIHHDQCLSWRLGDQYRSCMVCQEVCQYSAVEAREIEGQIRPVVITARCTGCGICENKCPIKPGAAIEVFRAD